jgi:hypothetical protein
MTIMSRRSRSYATPMESSAGRESAGSTRSRFAMRREHRRMQLRTTRRVRVEVEVEVGGSAEAVEKEEEETPIVVALLIMLSEVAAHP